MKFYVVLILPAAERSFFTHFWLHGTNKETTILVVGMHYRERFEAVFSFLTTRPNEESYQIKTSEVTGQLREIKSSRSRTRVWVKYVRGAGKIQKKLRKKTKAAVDRIGIFGVQVASGMKKVEVERVLKGTTPMDFDDAGGSGGGATVAVDVDDVDPLEIFGEGVFSALDNKLADADFFNSFEDDFEDSDIN